MKLPVMPSQVAEVFAQFPPGARQRLLELRALILETARGLPQVGPLAETVKWGEPAYLTETTRSGSTTRLGWKSTTPNNAYLYFHCRTDLVDSFRVRWSEDLVFEGNRAVVTRLDEVLSREPLQACIEAALTYHLRGGQRRPWTGRYGPQRDRR